MHHLTKLALSSIIFSFCFLPGQLFANAEEITKHTSINGKINTNIYSLVLFGDINVGYETPLDNSSSVLFGGHFNPDQSQTETTGQFGAFTAYRLYSENTVFGPFGQISLGLNNTLQGSDYKPLFSIELWGGISRRFSKNIYYEAGLGLGRQYRSDNTDTEPFVMVSLNVGFVLN